MIDNFEYIKDYLKFDSEDDFYIVEILQRRKDSGNEDLPKGTTFKRMYRINSLENYDQCVSSIKSICKLYNARAYINLNKRSYKKVGLQTLKYIADMIVNEDFKAIPSAYDKMCGRHGNGGKDKVWIIDIDSNEDMEKFTELDNVDELPVVGTLKTVNGYHVITKPFRPDLINNRGFEYEIKKDGLTLLYF
jgi:hypothetical protein